MVVTQTIESRLNGGELIEEIFVLTFADRENFRNDWEDEAFVLIDGEAQRLQNGRWSEEDPAFALETQIGSLDGMTAFRDWEGLELLGDGRQIDGEATVRYRIIEPDYGDGQAETVRLANQQLRQGQGESSDGPSELDEFAAAHEGAAGTWEFTVGRLTGRIYSVRFEVEGPNLQQTFVTEFRGYGEPVVVEPPL